MQEVSNIINKKIAPWVDNKGNILPRERLMEISKGWSAITWEQYLQTLEVQREEQLLKYPKNIERIKGDCLLNSCATGEELTEIADPEETLRFALKKLSLSEIEVIKKIYWEERSEACAAEELGLSRSSIRSLKKRACSKLLQELSQNKIQKKEKE
ncbi:MAG: hypothetical protein ISR65_02915 [Bacteriovoracaceae bacterium]|nr:hypothetical protein [Bacteriovoracaceae bacterium]